MRLSPFGVSRWSPVIPVGSRSTTGHTGHTSHGDTM